MICPDKAQPLVSCIMPTHNRREFVPLAIRYFLRQDYDHKELIILDDGTDCIRDLVPAQDQIRYLRLDKKTTVGTKRNLACAEARGELIVHWDDDDWIAPWRISYQVRNLIERQADVCGLNRLLYYDPLTRQSWQYVYPSGAKLWVAGGTLCYDKGVWLSRPFPDINVGEDGQFVWNHLSKSILVLEELTFYVAIKHPDNTSPKHVTGSPWRSHPTEEIQALMGDDLRFYVQPRGLQGARPEAPCVVPAAAAQAGQRTTAEPAGSAEKHHTYDIIMVVHNAREVVRMSTLQTLKQCANQSARLVVVDNMSNDGTETWLDILARRHDIDLIRCETNLGHGPGIELARRRTAAPYIVTLDSDAFPLRDNWLPRLRAKLKGATKVVGIRHHRDYIHPACLMIARKTLEELDVTFLDEKTVPSQLDVAERISHEVKRRGYEIGGLERTDAQCRGSASEPIYLGSRYEGLVHHQWYTTRAVTSSCRRIDDVPWENIERSLEGTLGRYWREARDVTVVMGIRSSQKEPRRLRNIKASLWSFNRQSLPRWRYRIVVVEQDSQPQLEGELAPLADRYFFAYNAGPYNRGWAFNIGASLSPGRTEVLCLTDADLVVPSDFLQRGLETYKSGQIAFLPYKEIVYLNPDVTEDVIRDCLAEDPGRCDPDSRSGNVFTTSQGGCVWVDAGLYHRIGGHDERFRGWGFEDREFFDRLARYVRIERLPLRLFHLYHAPAAVEDRWTTANRQLYSRISQGADLKPAEPQGNPHLYRTEQGDLTGNSPRTSQERRDWQNWDRWTAQRIEQIVRDEEHRPVQHSARRRLAETLVQLGNSLLDIGCGPGALWSHLREYQPRFSWVGVDITAEMLQAARRFFPEVPVYHADASSLPFDTDSLDLALLRHVLEHLPPSLMRRSLKEAMRVARKSVVLDFYVPPTVGAGRQTKRVGDNFLETRWATADIEEVVAAQNWKRDVRCLVTDCEGDQDEIWILTPSRETNESETRRDTPIGAGGPKISVIMPTYRRHHIIFRTISTIRKQTYTNWELLIIENAGDVVYEFSDPRIQFHRHCERPSASHARNRGLEHASGDLVCFFDDDDDMFPQYLERFAKAFSKHPQAKMARCGMVVGPGRIDYSCATPECCLRREFASPTWCCQDGQVHDQTYFRRIVSRHNWSQEDGDIVVIHEALCKANSDPRGGLRSGHY